MAMDAGEIERLIKAHIPDAQVTIRDLAGDGDHYAATVISASFKGKSRVQQHQIVYEALKGQMGGVLHALARVRLRRPAPGASVHARAILYSWQACVASIRRITGSSKVTKLASGRVS
jgi:stress-induced morphogen